jgi:hypothetical protein
MRKLNTVLSNITVTGSDPVWVRIRVSSCEQMNGAFFLYFFEKTEPEINASFWIRTKRKTILVC